MSNQETERIIDFMSIAKQFNLSGLREDISQLLMKNLTLENVALVYEGANINNQKQLKESCESFIDQNAKDIFLNNSLIKMSGEYLKYILGRNSFILNELDIYEIVQKWHVHFNKTHDLNQDLISKIRFDLISNDDLLKLTSQSNIINMEKAFKIMLSRTNNPNMALPTRKLALQTTTSTTTTTTTTTTLIKHNSKIRLASSASDKSIKRTLEH